MSADGKKDVVTLIQDTKDSIPFSHLPRLSGGATHRPPNAPVNPAHLIPPPGPSGVSPPPKPPRK